MSEQRIEANTSASDNGVYTAALTLGGVAAVGIGAALGGRAAWKGIKHLASDEGKAAAKQVAHNAKGKVKETGGIFKKAGSNVKGMFTGTGKDLSTAERIKGTKGNVTSVNFKGGHSSGHVEGGGKVVTGNFGGGNLNDADNVINFNPNKNHTMREKVLDFKNKTVNTINNTVNNATGGPSNVIQFPGGDKS